MLNICRVWEKLIQAMAVNKVNEGPKKSESLMLKENEE